MDKKTIKIAYAFVPPWTRGDIETLLKNEFNIVFDYENQEYVIFGVEFLWKDGYQAFLYSLKEYLNAITIFYSDESILPDFNFFDYIICRDNINFGDRYIRHFYNTNISDGSDRTKTYKEAKKILEDKKYFCNFIYSHAGGCNERTEIFNKLSEYKFVHALGNYKRNCDIKIEPRYGDWKNSSMEAKRDFKFSIAVENGVYRDGVTEKIYTSFLANTIPIYFGDSNIDWYFNKEAFINYHDYNSMDELIERVKEIDNNDELYIEILSKPFRTKQQLDNLKSGIEKSNNMIKNIFRSDIKKASRKSIGSGPNVIKNFIFGESNNILLDEKQTKQTIENLYNENRKLKIQLYELVNKVAWWIPFPKMRGKFRSKFSI